MAEFKCLFVPSEDYDALGIDGNTIIETYVNEKGELIVRALTDAEDVLHGQDCDRCPFGKECCNEENTEGSWQARTHDAALSV